MEPRVEKNQAPDFSEADPVYTRGPVVHYVPITQNGEVVDSQGFMLDPEDE